MFGCQVNFRFINPLTIWYILYAKPLSRKADWACMRHYLYSSECYMWHLRLWCEGEAINSLNNKLIRCLKMQTERLLHLAPLASFPIHTDLCYQLLSRSTKAETMSPDQRHFDSSFWVKWEHPCMPQRIQDSNMCRKHRPHHSVVGCPLTASALNSLAVQICHIE